MRYKIGFSVLSLALIALAACSSESDESQTRKETVWKDQTGAIDKAREVETILQRKQDGENQ
jgi:ABC-type Fe3+-citrate transport system substrate-binding protein